MKSFKKSWASNLQMTNLYPNNSLCGSFNSIIVQLRGGTLQLKNVFKIFIKKKD